MAAVNTQFSIAVHIMAGLGAKKCEVTSATLAKSVNTSPSFVRRVLAKLSKAGLVQTTAGKGGSCLLGKSPEKVSLYEIYRAVEAPRPFAIHHYPSQKSCAVSCGIKSSLENILDRTTAAMEKSLKEVSLAEVIAGIKSH